MAMTNDVHDPYAPIYERYMVMEESDYAMVSLAYDDVEAPYLVYDYETGEQVEYATEGAALTAFEAINEREQALVDALNLEKEQSGYGEW